MSPWAQHSPGPCRGIPFHGVLGSKPSHTTKELMQALPKVPAVLAGASALHSAPSVSFRQGAVDLSWQRQHRGKVPVLHTCSPYTAPHPSKWEGIWGRLWELLQGCDVGAFPNSLFSSLILHCHNGAAQEPYLRWLLCLSVLSMSCGPFGLLSQTEKLASE